MATLRELAKHTNKEQAEQLAKRCLANGDNITILGDPLLPGAAFMNGVDTTIFDNYILQHGGNINYCNFFNAPYDTLPDWTHVYVIGAFDSRVIESVPHFTWDNMTTINTLPTAVPNNTGLQCIIELYADIEQRGLKTLIEHPFDEDGDRIPFFCAEEFAPFQDRIHTIHHTRLNNVTVEDGVTYFNNIIDDGNIILIDDAMECLRQNTFTKVRLIADRLNNDDPRRIIYVSGGHCAAEAYQKYIKHHNLRDFMTVMSSDRLLYTMQHTDFITRNPHVIDYEIKVKDKKFVCFNRITKKHRLYILSKMLESGTFHKSYFSFEGAGNDNWLTDIEQRYNWSSVVVDQLTKHKDKFPIRLNITNERPNPFTIQEDDLIYHQNSYFSIVTETIFYKSVDDDNKDQYHHIGGLFFTEKTCRPLMLKHPFILAGREHSLKTLRDLGFRTFHPFINEDYDNEINDDKRLDMIVAEVERLSSFTDNEWITWQTNIKDIVEHNFKLVVNTHNIPHTEDIAAMLAEILNIS